MTRYRSGQVEALIAGMQQQAAEPPLAPVSPADILTTTSVIRLRVKDVKPFTRNPRTASNEKLAEIRESIRARGLDQMFAVTKRPQDEHYVTAKGGCTRLSAMDQLVDEGDLRFEYMDFLLYTFKSDSDLLAGHLSENLQRSDMTFWDTAKGILELRGELEKERHGAMSSREFEEALQSQGLHSSRPLLLDYQFIDSFLKELNARYHASVGRNDIRYILRPAQGLLEALWLKHGMGSDRFQQSFRLSVGAYEDAMGYAADRLVEHLHRHAAAELQYHAEEFALMLGALKANKDATLDELRARPESGGASTAHPDASVGDGDTTTDGGAEGDDGNDGGDGASEEDGDGDGDGDGADADARDPGTDERDDAGAPATSATNHGGIPSVSAASGIRVASGLVPDAIRDAAGTVAQADGHGVQQSLDGIGAPAGTGASSLAQALDDLWYAVQACADVVGIAGTVVPAPTMPYGWLMEIPAAGALGVSTDDLAVQGWWLLASLSGQLHGDIEALLNATDAQGAPVLPDTGPNGYREALSSDERWRNTVLNRLGGQTMWDLEFVLGVITHGNHPLTEPVIEVIGRIRDVHKHRIAEHGGALL